jgi:hypothetical protein
MLVMQLCVSGADSAEPLDRTSLLRVHSIPFMTSLRERGVLERYVEPIMAALRACGAPPDTADQKPTKKGRQRARALLGDGR